MIRRLGHVYSWLPWKEWIDNTGHSHSSAADQSTERAPRRDLFIPTGYLVKAFQEKNAREMPEYLVLLMRAAGVGGLSFPTLVRPRLLAVRVLQQREHTIQPHHPSKIRRKVPPDMHNVHLTCSRLLYRAFSFRRGKNRALPIKRLRSPVYLPFPIIFSIIDTYSQLKCS
jgi:hypothetical protein